MTKQSISFRWLGVAGLEFRSGHQVLLVDPFLTRPKVRNILIRRVRSDIDVIERQISQCNYILVTHSHFDHLMDVPAIISLTGAKIFGSANTCRLLALANIPKANYQLISPGDNLSLENFQVKVFAARHPSLLGFRPGPVSENVTFPAKLRDYRMDNFFSFQIETGGHKFLVWNDTDLDLTPETDVVFLVPEIDHHLCQKLLQKARPKTIIPIHWDDFFQPLTSPPTPSFRSPKISAWRPQTRHNLHLFTQMVKKIYPQGEVLLPEIFKTYHF